MQPVSFDSLITVITGYIKMISHGDDRDFFHVGLGNMIRNSDEKGEYSQSKMAIDEPAVNTFFK